MQACLPYCDDLAEIEVNSVELSYEYSGDGFIKCSPIHVYCRSDRHDESRNDWHCSMNERTNAIWKNLEGNIICGCRGQDSFVIKAHEPSIVERLSMKIDE